MRIVARTILLAMLLLVTPALAAGAATAAPAPAGSVQAVQAGTESSAGLAVFAGTTPTPSPGDTASSGPANPGTGESAENESTRLDWAPWVIAAIAVVLLVVILIWRRRRNTTIAG